MDAAISQLAPRSLLALLQLDYSCLEIWLVNPIKAVNVSHHRLDALMNVRSKQKVSCLGSELQKCTSLRSL